MPKRKRTFSGSASTKKRLRRTSFLGKPAARGIPRRRRTPARGQATMGFLTIERKFYDTGLASSALSNPTDCTAGEMDPSATSMITSPAQGDGEQNRDGKQIACLYVLISGVISFSGIEQTTDPLTRRQAFVAVVLDTQSNGAQLNSEDVFKNTIASANLAQIPQKNLLFGNRFRILKEKIFTARPSLTILAANDFSSSSDAMTFKFYIPLKGMKINFNGGTTASIANVIDNSIHVVAFKGTTTEVVAISYNARLRFVG